MDLSTGAVFSIDFGDFGGPGWSWVVSGIRFVRFVDRCSVFEGVVEQIQVNPAQSLAENLLFNVYSGCRS